MTDDVAARREQVAAWIRSAPRGPDVVREDVERFRDASPQERLDAFREIQALAELMLGDRPLVRPLDDVEFWRRWQDPQVGRPR